MSEQIFLVLTYVCLSTFPVKLQLFHALKKLKLTTLFYQFDPHFLLRLYVH